MKILLHEFNEYYTVDLTYIKSRITEKYKLSTSIYQTYLMLLGIDKIFNIVINDIMYDINTYKLVVDISLENISNTEFNKIVDNIKMVPIITINNLSSGDNLIVSINGIDIDFDLFNFNKR